VPGLPHFARPNIAELGWAIIIGLAAAVLCEAIRRGAIALRGVVQRQPLIWTPVAGLVVAGMAAAFAAGTGRDAETVLFSGQHSLAPFIHNAAAYGLAALVLLAACKSIGYGVSMSGFRGGPVFPAIFIGAVGGAAMAHLPGLPLVPALGMGMGGMLAGMLRLPLTSVFLATVLLFSDGLAIMPLVIVAVTVAYVTVIRLDRTRSEQAAPEQAGPDQAGDGKR
jgi:H+/Cl- antiporter ClcA